MDLHTIDTYLRLDTLEGLPPWEAGFAWLGGGTWLFSEPQPHLTTLVDLEPFGWSDIEFDGDRLSIGATCTFAQLLEYPWAAEWSAIEVFRDAISALAASFKVTHQATIGGNLCLALAVGVMAPVLVALDATYELWSPTGMRRFVAAQAFQTGIQQTVLQPGEVLRRVHLPIAALFWQTRFQRMGVATTDPALSLVVVACDPITTATRISLAACVAAPYLLQFSQLPIASQIPTALESIPWLTDARASGAYRKHITQVLIRRSLDSFGV